MAFNEDIINATVESMIAVMVAKVNSGSDNEIARSSMRGICESIFQQVESEITSKGFVEVPVYTFNGVDIVSNSTQKIYIQFDN